MLDSYDPLVQNALHAMSGVWEYGKADDLFEQGSLYGHLNKIFVPYQTARRCPFPRDSGRRYVASFIGTRSSRSRAHLRDVAGRLSPRFAVLVPDDARDVRVGTGPVQLPPGES